MSQGISERGQGILDGSGQEGLGGALGEDDAERAASRHPVKAAEAYRKLDARDQDKELSHHPESPRKIENLDHGRLPSSAQMLLSKVRYMLLALSS